MRCRSVKVRDMYKILIIDDQRNVLSLYSRILGLAGYEVLTASGAKEGIDLAISAQPELILLDVMMPSIDGPAAPALMSENDSTKHIPVIFLTSLLTENEAQEAQGLIGGHEFISKSMPHEQMIARVKSALAGAPSRFPKEVPG